MALKISTLLDEMTDAAKTSLSDKWPKIRDLAIPAFKNLAQNFVDIELMSHTGKITEEQARLLLDMQKNTLRIILLSEEGLGLLAAEAAINAALNVVKDAVNTAVGFILL